MRISLNIKNYILVTISMLMGIAFFVSAIMLDSESYIPMIVSAIAIVWFALFFKANPRLIKYKEKEGGKDD